MRLPPLVLHLHGAVVLLYIQPMAMIMVGVLGMLQTAAAKQVGAIFQTDAGPWGHVAYVESVNTDGSILISDMNYPIWGKVTYRTAQPSEFGNYRFIY